MPPAARERILRGRVPMVVGLLFISSTLLTACPGSHDPPPATSAPPTAVATTTIPPVDGARAAESYFGALASRDPERGDDMLEAAAPGSVAFDYATHQTAVRQVLGSSAAGSVDRSLDRALVCSGPAVPEQDLLCTEYRDLVFDNEGLLASFTVGGTELHDRIVIDGPAVTIDLVTVTAVSAYRSPSTNTILAVLEVANGGTSAFELFPFGATYRPTEESAAVEADASWGVPAIDAGATSRVIVRFTDAPLGGILQVGGWSEASIGTTFAVRVAQES